MLSQFAATRDKLEEGRGGEVEGGGGIVYAVAVCRQTVAGSEKCVQMTVNRPV